MSVLAISRDLGIKHKRFLLHLRDIGSIKLEHLIRIAELSDLPEGAIITYPY